MRTISLYIVTILLPKQHYYSKGNAKLLSKKVLKCFQLKIRGDKKSQDDDICSASLSDSDQQIDVISRGQLLTSTTQIIKIYQQ